MKPEGKGFSRRDFLKLSAAAAAAASLPGLSGCAGRKAVAAGSASGPALALVNGHVADVEKGEILLNHVILLDKGKVAELFPAGARDLGSLETLDLAGGYVLPGLMDAHCHSTLSGATRMGWADGLAHLDQMRHQYECCVRSGVTTIRDTGAMPGLLHRFLRDIGRGDVNGPRVVYCNSIINPKGGHPDIPPTAVHPLANLGALYTGLVGALYEGDSGLSAALKEHAKNADFIKLTMDRHSLFCGKPDVAVYEDRHLARIFSFADAQGLPVAAHCLSGWGLDRVTRYPVHSLEHLPVDRELTDQEARRVGDLKAHVVPTTYLALAYLMEEAFERLPEKYDTPFIQDLLKIRREEVLPWREGLVPRGFHETNLQMLNHYRSLPWKELPGKNIYLVRPEVFFDMALTCRVNLGKLRDAGAVIGAGMDSGLPFSYFGTLYLELEMLERCGLSRAEALRAATVNNAKILGISDKVGTVAPGRIADLLVLGKNPLADIRAYREPRMVFKEGALAHRA